MEPESGDVTTMAFVPKRTRISVERYQKMAECGAFTREDRIELIEGDMLDMAPNGTPHISLTAQLTRLLVLTLGDRAVVSPMAPVVLGDFSEPEPDLAVLKPRADFYRGKRPDAADALLVIEISESSLAFDQGIKRALYARYGIPEYWVVDVTGRCLHVYREPNAAGFAWTETVGTAGSVEASTLPGLRIEVRDLFP
jgi:Uma2 family endonuclease